MKVIIGGILSLREIGLKLVRALKWILTIPSYIFAMFDKSFHRHLALTVQMNFNARNSIVSFLVWFYDYHF